MKKFIRHLNIIISILIILQGLVLAQTSEEKQQYSKDSHKKDSSACEQKIESYLNKVIESNQIIISWDRSLRHNINESNVERDAYLVSRESNKNFCENYGDKFSTKKKMQNKIWQTQQVTIEELKFWIKQKDFFLINVHVPYAGELPQTDISIPFDMIEQNLDMLPEDKNTKLVIYCRSGNMSATALQKLTQFGYSNVFDVRGGMKAWVIDGNKLIFR